MSGEKTVVFALCGSFCTFEKVLPQVECLNRQGWQVLPLMSFTAAGLDTRFGTAEHWKQRLEELTGRRPIETLQGAEPLGPKGLAQAMVIAPCTGSTLARLNLGLSDTPVTLGAKSILRAGRPVLLAPSTNDGLGSSAANLAALLVRKQMYLVPFAQDDFLQKPNSLQSDFALIPKALACAMEGRQLQPVLLQGRETIGR